MVNMILRLPALSRKIGLKRSTIYDKLDFRSPRHDPTFPRPIRLGNGRAIGFVEAEAEDWLSRQIQQSRKSAA